LARIRSGIPELDEMLRGGFMPTDAVMIAGAAGTGKTTLALQYIVNGITKFGENGIYLSFEQMPDQIYRDAASFGWDLKKLEEERKFRLFLSSPNVLFGEGGENLLDEMIKEIGAKRIAIDSLSHLSMYVPEDKLRLEAYRLVCFLKARGLSSLYLWEAPQHVGTSFSFSEPGMSFLVDSIVHLRTVEIESTLRKGLVILKMRGSDHDKRLREYEITSTGMKVFAPFDQYQGLFTGSPTKLPSEKFKEMFSTVAKGNKK
jgi:circadian clock protein KaiC